MLRVNRTQLELLLAEMKRQNLDEVEIYHDDGYGMNYNQSITFRDIDWLGRWNKEQNDDYNLLTLQEYNTYICVSGSCISNGKEG
jgi:hypothetical protein